MGQADGIIAFLNDNYYCLNLLNFSAESGGCTKEELDQLAESGVDLAASSINCGNDFPQLDEMDQQKRGIGVKYTMHTVPHHGMPCRTILGFYVRNRFE